MRRDEVALRNTPCVSLRCLGLIKSDNMGGQWSDGRWDIEHQRAMDELVVTKRLAQALKEAGYMFCEEE